MLHVIKNRFSGFSSAIAFFALLLAGSTAFAEARAGAGRVGLGVILGEPTGISGEYRLYPQTSIAGGMGWGFGRDTAFHLHADYLLHDPNLITLEQERLDFYFGGGLRLKTESSARFGFRIPVGVGYGFTEHPILLFLELVPILDLAPGTDFSFNGGVGARYYF